MITYGKFNLSNYADCLIVTDEKIANLYNISGSNVFLLPRGEAAMRAEFERLLPVMRKGGFIPSCDHQTPPGVSLENYRIFVRLLAEYAQKAVN